MIANHEGGVDRPLVGVDFAGVVGVLSIVVLKQRHTYGNQVVVIIFKVFEVSEEAAIRSRTPVNQSCD